MLRWAWLGNAMVACTPGPVTLDGRPDDSAEPRPTGDRPLCKAEADAPPPSFAPELRAWDTTLSESNNRYYGELAWRELEAMGEDGLGTSSEEQTTKRVLRGWFRLRFGDLEGAIADLERAEAQAVGNTEQLGLLRSRQLLGVAWMRKAETVNCIDNGSGESCIVPFGPHAVHLDPTMMVSASAAYERALDLEPDQPSTLWLNNVTYMARGTWPDAVPEAWRLPDGFLDPEAPFPAWPNVLPELGITEATLSGGSVIEDFDGDGLPDLLVSTMNARDGMDLYLNEGDGGFCVASDASGVSSIPGLLSFSVADYDNDGDVDVLGPRAGWMGAEGTVRPSLLRNDGQGRFTDVAVAAGLDLGDDNGPTQVSAWGDVDGDGWLDVFVGRESEASVPRVSSLFRNRGDGTFEDVAASAGLREVGFVKGASFLDYDRDGDVDLAVSVFQGENRLYENRGDGTFVDRAPEFGTLLPFRSFSVAPLDYDQDGRQDLFVAAFTNNYAGGGPTDPTYFRSAESWVVDAMGGEPDPELLSETARLYRNTPDGWVDVTAEVGLDDIHATMGLSYGDFDADSFPDLLLSTGAPEYDALEPNTAYHNEGGRWFSDVTAAMGTGSLQKGHGISFGDVDGDGDQDLLVQLGGAFQGDVAPNQLFVNPTNEGPHVHRHTVTLRLEGVTVARSALHARIRVVTPSGDRWHVVGETGSFGNASLPVEVGLGDDDVVERVEIDWPNGAGTEVLEDVPVDHVVDVRQGEGVVATRPYAPFVLDGAQGTHAHGE
jgi:hypothetical protein